jgi:ketosteroid isomerase-like protein
MLLDNIHAAASMPPCWRMIASPVLRMEDAMASTQSEIKVLLDSREEACRVKDIDRLMSLYSPNIVYFDCVPPLQGFIGSDAVRRNFLRWFDEYEGPIGLEARDLNIAMSEDVAFAHMLHLDKGNVHLSKAGLEEAWIRSTVCCQRSSRGWLITHEHISWPFEFNKQGGTVVMRLGS